MQHTAKGIASLGRNGDDTLLHRIQSDIVTLDSADLQPPPPTAAGDTVVPFLEGLAAIEDRMVMVLNLAALSDGGQIAEAA